MPNTATPDNKKYISLLNAIVIGSWALFSIYQATIDTTVDKFWGRFDTVTAFAALFLIILAVINKNKAARGFWVPFILFTALSVETILNRRLIQYIPLCLSFALVSAAYMNYKMTFRYLIVYNGILLLVIATSFSGISGRLFFWLCSVIGSVFIFFLSRNQADQEILADNTEGYFLNLMANTPYYVVYLDNLFKVVYISKTMADMLHLSDPSHAVGRPLLDLFKAREIKLVLAEIFNMGDSYEGVREVVMEGEIQHINVIGKKMPGANSGILFHFLDITSLVLARIDAERADTAKSAFLAKTSHEIRTPMNAILGMAELILRNNIPLDIYENVQGIKQAGSNLLSIINDVLDFSKIESGKMDIIPVDYSFSSMVNDVINIIRIRIIEKPILFIANINSAIPNALIGDETRVRQILLNLLSNAVKFTDTGFISLNIWGSIIDGNTILMHYEVVDTGIGIAEENKSKLFGEFVQFDNDKNVGVEGSGLGLAISLTLSRLMGGDITLKSEYGKGSAFTVTLSQKIQDRKPVAAVANKAHALVFVNRMIYVHTLSYSLDNLGVPFSVVYSYKELRHALEEGDYTHAFISSSLFLDAKGIISSMANDTISVLIAELGEIRSKYNVPVIPMPVNTISIANVLNGEWETKEYADRGIPQVKFVFPKARILLVDDIATNIRVTQGLLAPYKTSIDTCTSGKEAIELVKKHQYDLVFMDHMMPDMDGIEATHLIRKEQGEYYRTLPIIALTANAVSGMREMFLENGMDDYLAKPIELTKLDEIIHKWIPEEKRELPDASPVRIFENSALSIQGLDTETGMRLCGGREDDYRDILSYYVRDTWERLMYLNSLNITLHTDQGAAENSEGVAALPLFTTTVHALKGASATIGALGISAEAAELEILGRTKDIASIAEKLGSFCQRLQLLATDISVALYPDDSYSCGISGSTHANDGDPITALPAEMLELFMQLRKALRDENIRRINTALKELRETKLEGAARQLLSEVADCVLISEFEEGADKIEALLGGT